MQLHTLQPKTKNRSRKRVGRGGIRGKTSGRGMKGQHQHGGHGIRPEMRDIISKLPKLRGFGINRSRTHVYKPATLVINVSNLEALFDTGSVVSIETLVEKKAVRPRQIETRIIKILGNGEIQKKLTIKGLLVSASAKEKIEKAGGKVEEQ